MTPGERTWQVGGRNVDAKPANARFQKYESLPSGGSSQATSDGHRKHLWSGDGPNARFRQAALHGWLAGNQSTAQAGRSFNYVRVFANLRLAPRILGATATTQSQTTPNADRLTGTNVPAHTGCASGGVADPPGTRDSS